MLVRQALPRPGVAHAGHCIRQLDSLSLTSQPYNGKLNDRF